MLMEGFSMVFGDPLSIVLVAAGTLIGTIFGAIPGLTATMAVTICLPMTFAMSDNRAIALLMALYIGGISGGLVSSILLNIPGTPASMVTAFDGAPMARKGEGAKALGTGILREFSLDEVQALRNADGAPYLAFSGRAQALMEQRGLRAHLSLTHEEGLATAFVLLEEKKEQL